MRRNCRPSALHRPFFFSSLISKLYNKYGRKVAVLIDKYDLPILEVITKIRLAERIRKTLKTLCNVLKAAEDHRGFTFITWVTEFSKASVFSSLNNFKDLTLDPRYAFICGFTLEEFDSLPADRLPLAPDEAGSSGD
ncbi:MAG: AAA family ATPase [Deltaproteobacteria bacterium]|jgi:hypothetical protein|nr:AAA family ATPase [Deltaproteobacteria bacterium]